MWELDPTSRVGLADQIVTAVRRAVVAGDLAAGDLLPTSKELATVLGVNPNTVLAAYRRLRDEQVLEFRRGRGVRVSGSAGDESRILEAAREFVRIGWSLGYSADQLPGLLHKAMER
jgi:DNA-binding transcriptional regulator YhcF (GntR family)